MLFVAVLFAGIATLVHVYIFALETLRWEKPATRKAFGISSEDARVTKPLAANQGVYNLLLAIVTAVGFVMLATSQSDAGAALLLAGTGSMVVAATYLLATDRTKVRPALVQGMAPLVAVVATVIWLA